MCIEIKRHTSLFCLKLSFYQLYICSIVKRCATCFFKKKSIYINIFCLFYRNLETFIRLKNIERKVWLNLKSIKKNHLFHRKFIKSIIVEHCFRLKFSKKIMYLYKRVLKSLKKILSTFEIKLN